MKYLKFVAALFVVGLFVLGTFPVCEAAPVQIVDAPASVVPGQSFAFNVLIPSTTSLAAYQIDITLSSNTGTVGTDYQFGPAVAASPLAAYVFNSTANYASAINNDSASIQRLSLSDFDLLGINTVEGANDRIANVTVQTTPSFVGSLELTISQSGLILDGPDFATPVPEFATILSDTAAARPISVTAAAVPEPSSLGFLLISSIAAVRRRHCKRTQ